MCKKLIVLILFLGLYFRSEAQETAVQQTIEDILGSMGDELTDDADIQEMLDDLELLREKPLKINIATREELARLHLLSEIQIDALVAFRKKTGTIFSIYELSSVDGFTPDLLQRIEPFVSFELQEQHRVGKKAGGDLYFRTNSTFSSIPPSGPVQEGSPQRYYLRLKATESRFN